MVVGDVLVGVGLLGAEARLVTGDLEAIAADAVGACDKEVPLVKDRPVSWMYWRRPPKSLTMSELYWAPSVKSLLCQASLPFLALRATTAPFFPPGVTMTLPPSTSGLSV